jgi:hypothetical protein
MLAIVRQMIDNVKHRAARGIFLAPAVRRHAWQPLMRMYPVPYIWLWHPPGVVDLAQP